MNSAFKSAATYSVEDVTAFLEKWNVPAAIKFNKENANSERISGTEIATFFNNYFTFKPVGFAEMLFRHMEASVVGLIKL